MAMIDDIMAQLTGLGFNMSGGFGSIGQFDAEEIATKLQQQFTLTSGQLPSSLFSPVSSNLMKGALGKTYSPQVEATGQSLLSNMLTGMGGEKGRQAAGGFAGSGQQQQYAGGIKDVYGKGMTDILTKTGQQRAQSLQSIQDMINQWQSQAMQVQIG